jgi:transcriptional regulator with XRE-family HTH domain
MDSPLAERFGRNLSHRRRLAGLSQDRLAELAEMHRTEIAAIERGLRLPRLDTILKVSRGVETSTCELLAGLPRWRPGYRVEGEFDLYDESTAVGTKGVENDVA